MFLTGENGKTTSASKVKGGERTASPGGYQASGRRRGPGGFPHKIERADSKVQNSAGQEPSESNRGDGRREDLTFDQRFSLCAWELLGTDNVRLREARAASSCDGAVKNFGVMFEGGYGTLMCERLEEGKISEGSRSLLATCGGD